VVYLAAMAERHRGPRCARPHHPLIPAELFGSTRLGAGWTGFASRGAAFVAQTSSASSEAQPRAATLSCRWANRSVSATSQVVVPAGAGSSPGKPRMPRARDRVTAEGRFPCHVARRHRLAHERCQRPRVLVWAGRRIESRLPRCWASPSRCSAAVRRLDSAGRLREGTTANRPRSDGDESSRRGGLSAKFV